MPQYMLDANIVTIYKNKGDRSDSSNYSRISLLNIVGTIDALFCSIDCRILLCVSTWTTMRLQRREIRHRLVILAATVAREM